MRTILVLLFMIVFLVLSIPLYLIIKLIGVFNMQACASLSQPIIAWVFKVIFVLAGVKMKVAGLENIPRDKAVLFAANHRSYADIPMAYITLPVLTGFIAKKEIGRVPSLSWWMTNVNCLFLDRHDMRKGLKTILAAIEKVKKGYSIFVMPEGTRNHENTMLPFKEGSFKVAEKTNCLIIPVAITNSDAIYELHKPWIRSARVMIHYGEPIDISTLDKENRKFIGARVREEIEKLLEEDAAVYKQ